MAGLIDRLRAMASAALPARAKADPLAVVDAKIAAARSALDQVPVERAKAEADDKLIAEGAATPAAAGDDGIRLAPDALPAKPRNRYFTRAGAAAR